MYIACKHGVGSDDNCIDCVYEENIKLENTINKMYLIIQECIEAHEMSSTVHGINLLRKLLKDRKD